MEQSDIFVKMTVIFYFYFNKVAFGLHLSEIKVLEKDNKTRMKLPTVASQGNVRGRS